MFELFVYAPVPCCVCGSERNTDWCLLSAYSIRVLKMKPMVCFVSSDIIWPYLGSKNSYVCAGV